MFLLFFFEWNSSCEINKVWFKISCWSKTTRLQVLNSGSLYQCEAVPSLIKMMPSQTKGLVVLRGTKRCLWRSNNAVWRFSVCVCVTERRRNLTENGRLWLKLVIAPQKDQPPTLSMINQWANAQYTNVKTKKKCPVCLLLFINISGTCPSFHTWLFPALRLQCNHGKVRKFNC